MGDADEKKKKKAPTAGEGGSGAGEGDAKYTSWSGNLSFYDAHTFAPLFPDGAKVEIETVDGESLWSGSLTRNKKNVYPVQVPKIPLMPAAPDTTDTEETPCDTPAFAQAAMVVVKSVGPVAVNCQPYSFSDLAIALPSTMEGATESTTDENEDSSQGKPKNPSEPTSGDTDKVCSVSIPLNRLEQAYGVTLRAYDTCFNDYLTNAKALVNDVIVKATAVRTQAKESQSNKFQAGTFTAKTVDGYLELSGLKPHELYRFEVMGPAQYVCVQPPKPYLHNLGAQTVALEAHFQPCGKFPARSVIFVQEACSGQRVQEMAFTATGVSPSPSVAKKDHGIWNIPPGTEGNIEFQSPGKVFSPSSINLTKDAPISFIVKVADQQVAQLGSGRQRFRFLDEEGKAFAHRQLRLKSRSGYEETVHTDEGGWFWAEEGAVASAEDDESGYALSEFPLLTGEIE
jgi:hypothetical protein